MQEGAACPLLLRRYNRAHKPRLRKDKQYRSDKTMDSNTWVQGKNPITRMDFPDPDIIRVGDTYYMVSTTMYFMPGCVILRSYDLIHWEYLTRVYDTLEDTPAQRLEGRENAYGKGMWAATLRYHEGTFYICFVANDTHKTYLYRAQNILGPWEKSCIEGFYHDCSLLFDDDGRKYIVYGNKVIRLTELNDALTAPKENGLDRVIADTGESRFLGYEGSHFYKINGKYYLFVIHSLKDRWKRVESCFCSDTLEGDFTGGIVFNDDFSYFGNGVAQGAIVDTPDGRWYCCLFQDRGAVGRIPVLLPMQWENDMPVIGEAGKTPLFIANRSERPGHLYAPLYGGDDFERGALKPYWEWNHSPDQRYFALGGGAYRIVNGKRCESLTQAVNTLTQRGIYPGCEAFVTLDGADMRDGDAAGLCVLQDLWGYVGLEKERGRYALVMREKRRGDPENGVIAESIPMAGSRVRLKARMDFKNQRDEALFFYELEGQWKPIGRGHKMAFLLSHFTGNRFGLFSFSTREPGGGAAFSAFRYRADEDA